jgi:hypothetical protein
MQLSIEQPIRASELRPNSLSQHVIRRSFPSTSNWLAISLCSKKRDNLIKRLTRFGMQTLVRMKHALPPCVWQSGRGAHFPSAYGRMCQANLILKFIFYILVTALSIRLPIENTESSTWMCKSWFLKPLIPRLKFEILVLSRS